MGPSLEELMMGHGVEDIESDSTTQDIESNLEYPAVMRRMHSVSNLWDMKHFTITSIHDVWKIDTHSKLAVELNFDVAP